MKVGSVIRIFAQDTNPPKVKLLIIVGDVSGELAIIYINSTPRIQDFPDAIQSSQLALSAKECTFLKHDSFADCSDLRIRSKGEINSILQKDPGRYEGELPAHILESITHLLKQSRTLAAGTKRKFGFL